VEIIDVRKQLARHPSKEYTKRTLEGIKYLVVHHSATSGGDASSFARYHVNNLDWPGIGYHYVILEDGTIQWTNDLNVTSYHVKGYNNQSIGICLVGDFTIEILKKEQKAAVKELIRNLLSRLNLGMDAVKGHNEFSGSATACPALDMDALRKFLNEEQVEVYINNEKLDIPVELKGGVTYVAIRSLGEALGYDVEWDGDKNRVYLIKDDVLEQVQQEGNYYLSIINNIKKIVSEV